jgi:hypothetical protein
VTQQQEIFYRMWVESKMIKGDLKVGDIRRDRVLVEVVEIIFGNMEKMLYIC